MLDNTDRKILHLVSQNPEISQVDLAKQLGISQPAVSARIRKLKETGLLAYLAGIEIKKAQMFLAKIDILTNDAGQVLDYLQNCPMYLNGFLTSGKYNLTVLLIGENMRSIVSCVDSHLRPNPVIREMNFDLVVTPVRDFVVPIKPILDKKKIAPCKRDCNSCAFYKDSRCLGCPASTNYKGNVL